jgi:hypothetical protein
MVGEIGGDGAIHDLQKLAVCQSKIVKSIVICLFDQRRKGLVRAGFGELAHPT